MSGLRIIILMLCSAPATASMPYFVHCYDFGCKSTHEIHYSPLQWDRIKSIFKQTELDRDQEKQAIRQAIATMERFSGEIAGTYRDKAGNYPGYDIAKQMDCIDESTNTFQYLLALEDLQLLQHHRVDQKYRRIIFIFTHWTAAVAEIDSERIFVVDSWYRDNGEPPYIQPLEDWQRKRDWPPALNPELATR